MPEETDIIDNRIHIKLKRHFIKHGKRLHSHIKKHHKKYLFGSVLYGIFHVTILNVLAFKLLAFKFVLAILTFFGVYNQSLTDIFAKMDNICINNNPIIAGQMCDKRFDTIQDAVKYLESIIDPETDNIYNAQYYNIIKSMIGEYCGKQIDKKGVDQETSKINAIDQTKDINQKLDLLKQANEKRKNNSLESDFKTETQFCNQKYLAYDMLDLSQSLFIKQLKKSGLISPEPINAGAKLNDKSDKIVLDNFANLWTDKNPISIKYLLADLGTENANTIANIIKNISLSATDESLNDLKKINILTDSEKQDIKSKISLMFISSCNKNNGYHQIKQYYNDNNVLDSTELDEIKLSISLCNSYQYIDQLQSQVKKLLIHEIGHYMYYFKDKSTNKFENICRTSKGETKTNKCDIEEFVSKYSQTSSEEDYADTFSRWALTQINKDKKYLSYYRRSIDVSSIVSSGSKLKGDMIFGGSHGVASYIAVSSDNAISRKFSYFDNLLSKAGGKVVIVK